MKNNIHKNINLTLTLGLIMLAISSCKQKQVADMILHNATIYSVDSTMQIHSAVAMKEGIITAVGTDSEVLSSFASQQTIDLGGKPLYPGFNDAHSHFYGLGLSMQIVDLVGTKSWEEVLQRTLEFHQKNPSDHILGRGWDQNDWATTEMPNNTKLDSLFNTIPVVLRRIDGHAALANSVALKAASITASTTTKGGYVIVKNNKLTGLLIDNAAELVMKAIPKKTDEFIEKAFLKSQQVCIENGLTSVTDAGLEPNEIAILKKLVNDNKIKLRVNAWLGLNAANLATIAKEAPFRSDFLNISTLKVYADGAMGSRGACLTSPYSDDIHHTGLMLVTPDSLTRLATLCNANNYQMAVHCIGDSAVRTTLKSISKVLQPNNDKRWRIEHAQVVQPSDYTIFKEYAIIPSVQPTHATSDMYWADERLGAERLPLAYSYQSLLNIHGWMPLGTDFPIEKVSPLLTFFAAVYRRDTKNYPEGGFQIKNALTTEQALRGITIWAAKASFEEDKKGSIEVGKWADFVVLSNDIMKVEPMQVPTTEVLKTIVAGKLVYSK